eukprot:591823-Prymnesium_polylepis.1
MARCPPADPDVASVCPPATIAATKAPGGEGTPPRKVFDVRNRAALLRCATGGRERGERSGAEERPLPWRAGP